MTLVSTQESGTRRKAEDTPHATPQIASIHRQIEQVKHLNTTQISQIGKS
jgi:hypothetical protein